METEELEVVTFRDLFNFVRRGLLFALLVGIAAGGLAWYLAQQTDPTYRARSTLLASQPGESNNFGVSLVTAPPIDVSAYRAASTSHPVLMEALEMLGQSDANATVIDGFRDRINVRTETTNVSSLVHVEVEGGIPVQVASEAQAVGQALLNWDTDRATRNLENIVDTLEAQIASLDSQISEARVAGTEESLEQLDALQSLRADYQMQLNSARALRSSAVGRLEILEPAQVPVEPIAPRPLLNAALAFVLGVFLWYGLLLLRDALDTRLRGTEDLAKTVPFPVLAEFPRQSGRRRLPREASSYLRTNLLFLLANAHPKVIVVSSSNSAQGKSSVALSLAESFARNDHRTLLVDADLRKPVLGSEYNINPRRFPPLRAHLENPHEDFRPARVEIDANSVLEIIPSFEAAPNPTELLSQGFQPFLRKQLDRYDVIVIDSAPILPVADTLTLAPHATGVVFTVSMQDADRRSLTASLELLERLGVKVLGTVATNVEGERSRSSDRYGYGYGYGYGEQEATSSMRPAKQRDTYKTGERVAAVSRRETMKQRAVGARDEGRKTGPVGTAGVAPVPAPHADDGSNERPPQAVRASSPGPVDGVARRGSVPTPPQPPPRPEE